MKSGPEQKTRGARRPYVHQACNFCRMRKTRCDGTRPVCTPCNSSGHECTWGSESAKRPSTKSYVESLKNRIEALEGYVKVLEKKVTHCTQVHGGADDGFVLKSDLALSPTLSFSPPIDDNDEMESLVDSELDEDICAPTKHLVLEEDDLQLYGPTSIFRLAPKAQPLHTRFPDMLENNSETYILLVEGADLSTYNPDFDWSRYLPLEVPMERQEHDRLLDLLFKFFTSWCLRIVPVLFLRDMYRVLRVPRSQTPPKTPHYSPMLHNALMSLATAFSDQPRIRDLNSRQYFARKAKEYIEAECQRPNISVVHALSILASFHSSQGDQTLGYLYFGMSGRMSQALGLGVDCSPWVKSGLITRDEMLDRNWAHWTTFSNDVCWSLYVGRDFCVSSPTDLQRIPVPFVDSGFDQIPWHYPASGIDPQPNYLSRTFVETCELLRIARRIMDVVNGLTNPGTRQEITQELISKIDVQLNGWKDGLSPEVDLTSSTRATALPHRIMLHAAYWWLFILLHRPFYRRARPNHSGGEKDIDHVKLCNRAAENIMELAETYRKLYTLRYVSITWVQVVFSAGTVFILSAVQATSGSRLAHVSLQHSLSQVDLCIQYLTETGRSWNCANNIAEILKSLRKEQLIPRLNMRSIDESRLNSRKLVSTSSFQSPVSEDVKPILSSSGSPVESTSATTGDEDYPSVASSPPTDMSNSFRSDWDLSGTGNNAPFMWDDPMSTITGSQWGGTDLTFMGSPSDAADALRQDFGGFPGLTGGEMLPIQPFMPFGMPGAGNNEYYQSQYGYSPMEQQPPARPLTEEDVEALNVFLGQQQVTA
ncbi:hypothetical protein HWV62_41412 [Athelia sp. TMB]|nr:hypothetical protein HWV62_34024 [Athelia sp. TMB]KAF7986045.1 hypothetical protein HWV62_41412 [Athelia sp. TMB]